MTIFLLEMLYLRLTTTKSDKIQTFNIEIKISFTMQKNKIYKKSKRLFKTF